MSENQTIARLITIAPICCSRELKAPKSLMHGYALSAINAAWIQRFQLKVSSGATHGVSHLS
jgi:hypothetical protein